MAVGKRKALGTAGQRGFLILPGGMRSVGGIAVELERRKALTGGEHAHVKKTHMYHPKIEPRSPQ